MMWGYDFGWGGWLLMTFGMALWVALLVVLAWALIRWLDAKTTMSAPPGMKGLSAMEILRLRYARGEIDLATFEQIRERIEPAGEGTPSQSQQPMTSAR